MAEFIRYYNSYKEQNEAMYALEGFAKLLPED